MSNRVFAERKTSERRAVSRTLSVLFLSILSEILEAKVAGHPYPRRPAVLRMTLGSWSDNLTTWLEIPVWVHNRHATYDRPPTYRGIASMEILSARARFFFIFVVAARFPENPFV